jgi:hypothetical protein
MYVRVLMAVFVLDYWLLIDLSYLQALIANVTLKDSLFQPSSPLRHSAELAAKLKKRYAQEDIAAMFMFTDGVPDHNCKHISGQVGLLALILFNKRHGHNDSSTSNCTSQIWTNPAKLIICVLNLKLQGVLFL